ncbi:uncharacterized protein MONBRDRAFT_28489 [Monosiga brevicollis MX1]|uniref:Kazal-like domain-containing protein n=1 Tax=Monosiga brevicollis TaxID=81824 RepID=A9V8B4_MONBE|nr:uncharacterized protein MONBRDRAFT_28489 [Monosiga brevicollis MX1]EDQ86241.1 predicted protein [Monosiga brevicollis MX1]|eukprot:XP_001748911.1 hypothetical protein [Monosiga brevicollis MX1]
MAQFSFLALMSVLLATATVLAAPADDNMGSGSGMAALCDSGCQTCTETGYCQACMYPLHLLDGGCTLACPVGLKSQRIQLAGSLYLLCVPEEDDVDSGSGSGDGELEGSGSGDAGLEDDDATGSCDCINDELDPVCWVENQITLPSPCHARCLQIVWTPGACVLENNDDDEQQAAAAALVTDQEGAPAASGWDREATITVAALSGGM